MGYKLAGFNVLGGVEIDPEMMGLYRRNFAPRASYLMGVQDFKRIPVPKELDGLDVLDGSPPCSSFSMAGAREKKWGESHKFREGQSEQVLDDLFFHFIDIAAKVRPKFVVAENVKGLVIGKARGYVKEIFQRFRSSGYEPQLFLLNSSRMGVPQARERTVFMARRSDLPVRKISMSFSEPEIPLLSALQGCETASAKTLPASLYSDWVKIKSGKPGRYFSTSIADPMKPAPTLTSKCLIAEGSVMHFAEPRKFSRGEAIRIQSFPEDYDFGDVDPGYVMGMSVPPLMMQRVADQVHRQWILPLRK